jgi:hypothetical protein
MYSVPIDTMWPKHIVFLIHRLTHQRATWPRGNCFSSSTICTSTGNFFCLRCIFLLTGRVLYQDMPSKTKNIVCPLPNYQLLENCINTLDLENLSLGVTGVKSKGKHKQVPHPVPSGIKVSKESMATIKVAKRKSIKDCVDDGPGPVSISINHLYLLISVPV